VFCSAESDGRGASEHRVNTASKETIGFQGQRGKAGRKNLEGKERQELGLKKTGKRRSRQMKNSGKFEKNQTQSGNNRLSRGKKEKKREELKEGSARPSAWGEER